MKHGGKRKGAGRKPIADKKIALTIYMPESIIKKCGGEYFAKSIMENSLLLKARKNGN